MTHYRFMAESFAAALAIALLFAAWAWPALGHEATNIAGQPLGWKYPYNCCSDNDCRPVTSGPNGVVRETTAGYVIAASNEVIPYSDPRVKVSPDQDFHWCSVAGLDDSRTLCLFVPNRGF